MEKENETLKIENKCLVEKNDQLSKQVQFYKRAVDKSFRNHKEENKDFKIVTDLKEDFYERVEENQKGKNIMKTFLLLTIFTIVVQTVQINKQSQEILSGKEASGQLNFFELDGFGENKQLRDTFNY